MVSLDYILVVASIIFLLSVIASKASGRLGVPALLLFLAIGMLAGEEGPGGIAFDDPWLAQTLGIVALAYILFAAGLETEWNRIRRVVGTGLLLSTGSVLLTALLLGWFASLVLPLTFLEGLLLGAIVSSTDAAAVFSILRSRNVSLKGRLRDVLELEAGSNDPMAVFLTMGVISLLLAPGSSAWQFVPWFVVQMGLGAGIGYVLGRLGVALVNRVRLEYEGLYPVLTAALVLLAYGATSLAGGNGFLAVYLCGLVMGNSDLVHKRSLRVFHDGIAWLMQIAMFLALGLLVTPSKLVTVAGVGLLLSAFLMLVARPVSVVTMLVRSRFRWSQKAVLSWVGLRGAVPIILATFPLLAGVPQADVLFHLVFFIVITSVLLQGTTITPVARWVGETGPLLRKSRYPLEMVPGGANIHSDLVEFELPPNSKAVGKQIVNLGLPKGALIVLMSRQDELIVPTGSTQIQAGDTLLVLAERHMLDLIRKTLEAEPRPVG
jgi:cell volume regulation protein A